MRPATLKEIEFWCGLSSGVVGLLLAAYALLVEPAVFLSLVGGWATLILYLVGLAAVAIATYLDSHVGGALGDYVGVGLLWPGVAAIWAFVVTGYLTINWYVVPAAVLALLAAGAGTVAHLEVSRVI